jgi:hypothetical protein
LKIDFLVASHVVIGLLLTIVAHRCSMPDPWLVAMLAWSFADAGLLGIWAALGSAGPRWRIPIFLTMSAYVACLTASLWGGSIENFDTVSVLMLTGGAAIIVFLSLTIFRIGRRLHLAAYSTTRMSTEGFQFTIKHLFIIMAMVAAVLGLGRWVQSLVAIHAPDDLSEVLLFVAVVCPCVVSAELAVLWAALGMGPPTVRLFAALPASFLLGTIPPYYLKVMIQPDWKDFVAWSCMIGLQAVVSAGSLLVVRSCGYRIVRGTRPSVVMAAGRMAAEAVSGNT